MCLSPIYIPDKSGDIKLEAKKYNWKSTLKIDRYGIHPYKYMPVPCGHCKQCIAIAQMEMIERIQMESLEKDLYMITTTYNNEHLPHYQAGEFSYRYADYKDAARFVDRMRRNHLFGIDFSYLIISERGGKNARPHFHILLLFNKKDIGKSEADKYCFEEDFRWKILEYWERPYYKTWLEPFGKGKEIDHYEPLCTYIESYKYGKKRATYDFHYVSPNWKTGGITNAAFYVLKYMMKESWHEEEIRKAIWLNHWDKSLYKNVQDSEAWVIWNTIKSRREYSLGFGLGTDYAKMGKNRKITKENSSETIINYLRRCIDDSKREKFEYAYYFSPENVNTFPLANYYKKFPFIYTREDEDYFFNINPERYRKRYIEPEHLTPSELGKQIADFERIQKELAMEDVAYSYDELLNNKKNGKNYNLSSKVV